MVLSHDRTHGEGASEYDVARGGGRSAVPRGALRWSLVTATDAAAARARLLEIIKEKAIVHGRVTLSSGKEADYYVDLRRISLDGEAAPLVGIVMRELTKDL